MNRDAVLRRMLPFARVPALAAVLLVAGFAPHGRALAATPGAGEATGNEASGTLHFRFVQAGAATIGSFDRFNVTLTIGADGAPTALAVTVDTNSLDTRDKDRDSALRASDLFDVKQFPHATFAANSVRRTAAGRYEAPGKLTIRGITRDVVLPFTLAAVPGAATSTWQLAGELPLRRLDYGVGQGEWRSTEDGGRCRGRQYSVKLTAALICRRYSLRSTSAWMRRWRGSVATSSSDCRSSANHGRERVHRRAS